MTELTVITDRDLKIAYIKTLLPEYTINMLDDGGWDTVIASIDWTILNQCPECHTYFDNGDGTDDDRFCSDDCKYEIELGRKRVRGHNLFNV